MGHVPYRREWLGILRAGICGLARKIHNILLRVQLALRLWKLEQR